MHDALLNLLTPLAWLAGACSRRGARSKQRCEEKRGKRVLGSELDWHGHIMRMNPTPDPTDMAVSCCAWLAFKNCRPCKQALSCHPRLQVLYLLLLPCCCCLTDALLTTGLYPLEVAAGSVGEYCGPTRPCAHQLLLPRQLAGVDVAQHLAHVEGVGYCMAAQHGAAVGGRRTAAPTATAAMRKEGLIQRPPCNSTSMPARSGSRAAWWQRGMPQRLCSMRLQLRGNELCHLSAAAPVHCLQSQLASLAAALHTHSCSQLDTACHEALVLHPVLPAAASMRITNAGGRKTLLEGK